MAHTWALVLAAGEGSRLRGLTTTSSGASVPKQFCSLQGGLSLFHEALLRAQSITTRSRICAVVAGQHRIWWESLPLAIPPANFIVQPHNRGTGNGILLPLLHLLSRDPDAELLILPSDHYVDQEQVLANALDDMFAQLRTRPEDVILLGVRPREADTDLGYIVPVKTARELALPVATFVEKPSPALARQIIEQGGLWNAFIVAATARGLCQLFERQMPALVEQMRRAVSIDLTHRGCSATEELYARLPNIDFSRDVLTGRESALRVLPVENCGWTDLGTIRGVQDALAHLSAASMDPMLDWSHLSLAAQFARLNRADRIRRPSP
jgi:mannose-1-phosphate guanylyltransferase